ncbi:hypothetical protein EMPS_07780 [Entomortierella parvispora]|uniref:Uncharacterized protein n=1 Tax=Entomortierella parvispora TaxID=205924 RepID=A0A9P3HFK4_9FUNG|nr:hypothetical protein EMPS_07780 [Entomortierella parvispora]
MQGQSGECPPEYFCCRILFREETVPLIVVEALQLDPAFDLDAVQWPCLQYGVEPSRKRNNLTACKSRQNLSNKSLEWIAFVNENWGNLLRRVDEHGKVVENVPVALRGLYWSDFRYLCRVMTFSSWVPSVPGLGPNQGNYVSIDSDHDDHEDPDDPNDGDDPNDDDPDDDDPDDDDPDDDDPDDDDDEDCDVDMDLEDGENERPGKAQQFSIKVHAVKNTVYGYRMRTVYPKRQRRATTAGDLRMAWGQRKRDTMVIPQIVRTSPAYKVNLGKRVRALLEKFREPQIFMSWSVDLNSLAFKGLFTTPRQDTRDIPLFCVAYNRE